MYALFWARETLDEYAARVATLSTKSAFRQFAEQYRLAVRFGVAPENYYRYGLFRTARLPRDAYYVDQASHRLFMERINRADGVATFEKFRFHQRARAAGIAIVPNLAVFWAGRRWPVEGTVAWPPRGDLFVKRSHSTRGQGAMAWRRSDDGRFRSNDGCMLTPDALGRYLERLSASSSTPFLVQELLSNHPELRGLSAAGASVVRIVTHQSRSGPMPRFEVLWALFKMPRAGDTTEHLGIKAPVDVVDGTLGEGFDAADLPAEGLDTHPDTRVRFTGRRLPCWDEVVDLSLRAHALVPAIAFVGWDVVITPSGPLLLEGNPYWFVSSVQRGHGVALGATRYPELCLRWLDAT